MRGDVGAVTLLGNLLGPYQEVRGAAGRVDDALIRARIDDLDNEPDDLAGREVLAQVHTVVEPPEVHEQVLDDLGESSEEPDLAQESGRFAQYLSGAADGPGRSLRQHSIVADQSLLQRFGEGLFHSNVPGGIHVAEVLDEHRHAVVLLRALLIKQLHQQQLQEDGVPVLPDVSDPMQQVVEPGEQRDHVGDELQIGIVQPGHTRWDGSAQGGDDRGRIAFARRALAAAEINRRLAVFPPCVDVGCFR
jgi:hypothetical protein